jgi:hypothetical protein
LRERVTRGECDETSKTHTKWVWRRGHELGAEFVSVAPAAASLTSRSRPPKNRSQNRSLPRRILPAIAAAAARPLTTTRRPAEPVTIAGCNTVDVPARFRSSKTVGAAFGLTPAKYQSGEINCTGAIPRCGDEMMRMMLYEAAQSMLVRSTRWSWLKAWAMKIARRRGMKKAIRTISVLTNHQDF